MNRRIDFDLRGSTDHIIEFLEVPAFAVGLRGTITAANEKATGLLLDAKRQCLDGIAVSAIVCPSTAVVIHAWMDDIQGGRSAQSKLCLEIPHSTSSQLWSAVKLKDSDGNLTGFIFQQAAILPALKDQSLPASINSPTDAARLDDLTNNELRWKTAVLSAEQGVWDHDFELDQHFLSETWHKMRGISSDASVAESTEEWLQTIHPDDVDRVKAELALQESGQTDIVNYTFRQRHADGHWIWILSRGRVVRRNANGFPVRIIGTDTDISDLKEVEHERTRLAERLGMAMDAAEMAQWELHIDTNRTTWDDQALKLFGLKDGQNHRPETDWGKMIHPEDREATTAYNDACLRDRKDIACDYRILTADGIEKYIRTRGKYVPDPEGGDRYIGVNFDLTPDYMKTLALEKARSRLEYESRHDALTGLANRRRLDEVYTAQTEAHFIRPMVAMHFDIDRFKQINDTLGHDAGDITLKHAAAVLQECLPKGVLVARVGGDEFVALFSNAPDRGDIEMIADRIITTFGRPFPYNGTQINTSISVGIAISEPRSLSGSNLFISADMALYHAKKSGRATFRFYSPNMIDQASRQKKMQDDLVNAFEQDEIICHYQPQFDAQTMKLSGIEALVRWDSPIHGLVLPDKFLSAAEDVGLIRKLDETVLRRVLADLSNWTTAGVSVPRISVNISAQRLTDPDLGSRLHNMNIPAGMISFELLESVFLDGEDTAVSTNLRMIESMGIDIEIDDFGTGHASIISLLRIAPKRLKIDRELVQPIVHSLKRRALLEALIKIGRMLNIEVIAEGVETDAHIDILRNLKCDYLQGFALARPMGSAAIRDILLSQ